MSQIAKVLCVSQCDNYLMVSIPYRESYLMMTKELVVVHVFHVCREGGDDDVLYRARTITRLERYARSTHVYVDDRESPLIYFGGGGVVNKLPYAVDVIVGVMGLYSAPRHLIDLIRFPNSRVTELVRALSTWREECLNIGLPHDVIAIICVKCCEAYRELEYASYCERSRLM